jgi:four helix bundle protein
MKIERFEDLEVWNLSRRLVNCIYKMTNNENFSRDFGLVNQMQRCSVSIMSNIAEGFERKGKKEFIHFLYTAKGSCGELRSQLYIALDLNYIDRTKFDESYNLSETVSKLIAGLIKHLQTFLEP